jgi:hypothetical protein
MTDLTRFSGTKPNKDTQSSEEFDTNVQNWVGYTTELPDEINDFIDELAIEVSNITTQAGISTTQAGISTAQAVLATEQVSLATIQANNAASSAQTALLAPGTSASSTTSASLGYGSKTFTIETGKLFVEGMTLKADSAGNWIIGTVSSYNSGSGELVLNATTISGVGTYSDWTISISAPIPDVPGGYNLFSFQNYI